MAWPYTTEQNWATAHEPTVYDDYPVEADTIIYAGCPVTLDGTTLLAHPAEAGATEKFAGFAERTADNTVASATRPNLLYTQNYGDGTAGEGGAKVRVRSAGRIRFDSRVPDGTGVAGTITGLAGDQTDVGTVIYYNGTGFTTSSAGNAIKVGVIEAVGDTLFGSTYWDLEFESAALRTK